MGGTNKSQIFVNGGSISKSAARSLVDSGIDVISKFLYTHKITG